MLHHDELCPPPKAAVCAAKQYLDGTLLSCSGGAYVPPCRNCVTNIAHVIFVGTNYSATGAAGCLATCQQGYYHTRLLRGGYAAAPVALGEIRDCQPCTDNLTVPCGGFCSASFYLSRNTSTCLPCSSAQCPLGTYRGPCASDADAPCLPCAPLHHCHSSSCCPGLFPCHPQRDCCPHHFPLRHAFPTTSTAGHILQCSLYYLPAGP